MIITGKIAIKVMGITLLTMILLFALGLVAMASAQDMPWEGPIDKIQNSLTGPVAKGLAIITIVITGIMFAQGESGTFFQKGMGVVFGLSLAFGAATLVANLFGKAAGLLF